ncbi:MAG: MFS transporter [Rhizobiaceae bacterium]|nr:MFS transporter [Rhizobiaceae bacterium]MBL4733645.1 MFS transporter [Rhizobiaceae bacterium]MBL4733680.1 MFS transporter [Rhizobiaceae bacterium]
MTTSDQSPEVDSKRWIALWVIATATLMIVLDISIINIALPAAQADLGISDMNRPWVVTAYALTFGGLLLLGGRIADFYGRKRMFIIGLVGFGIASILGGLAQDSFSLIAARTLQGVFGAILSPAALSLLTTAFTEPKERAKAFGVYGAVQGMGGAVGLLLGGALTEYVGWRWCLFVNVPICLAVIAAAIGNIRESHADAERSFDLLGALLSMIGLAGVVYGFTLAAEDGGLSQSATLLPLAIGVVSLVAFVIRQNLASSPLLPMRLVTDRKRAAAFLSLVLLGAGMFGMLLFLSFYLQVTLGFSPFQTGLAVLPFSIGVIAGSSVASKITPNSGEPHAMLIGLGLAVIGIALLAFVDEDSSYFALVMPGLLVMSFGIGIYFVPASSLALTNVPQNDAGVASALVNATQQIGGALGPALFNAIFLAVAGGAATAASDIEGYRAVFLSAAGLYALALIAVLMLAGASKTSP